MVTLDELFELRNSSALRTGQKPPQWSIDPGIVAYNASRLGLPMPTTLFVMWEKDGIREFFASILIEDRETIPIIEGDKKW